MGKYHDGMNILHAYLAKQGREVRWMSQQDSVETAHSIVDISCIQLNNPYRRAQMGALDAAAELTSG